MRRWIALVLLIMFPLQAIQAANTGPHEHHPATQHQHAHDAAPALLAVTAGAIAGDVGATTIASAATRPTSGDCGVCHLVHVPGIITPAAAAFPAPHAGAQRFIKLGNARGDVARVRPERPKWLRPV